MYVLLKQEVWWMHAAPQNVATSYLFVAAPQKLYRLFGF